MKLTEFDLEKEIAGERFYRFPNTTVTVCALKLVNGMVLIGHSACIDWKTFDETVGKAIARDKAKEQLWELLAFRAYDEKNK